MRVDIDTTIITVEPYIQQDPHISNSRDKTKGLDF